MLAGRSRVFVSKKFAGVVTPAHLLSPCTVRPHVVGRDVRRRGYTTAVGRRRVRSSREAAAAPVPGALNVTVTFATGLPPASFTWLPAVAANAVLIVALCGVPLVAVMLRRRSAVFVSKKFAGVVTPATLAVTVYGPPQRVGRERRHVLHHCRCRRRVRSSANCRLAPVPGALNVTVTFATGLPPHPSPWLQRCRKRCVDRRTLRFAARRCNARRRSRRVRQQEVRWCRHPATLAVTVYGAPATLLAVKVADVANHCVGRRVFAPPQSCRSPRCPAH